MESIVKSEFEDETCFVLGRGEKKPLAFFKTILNSDIDGSFVVLSDGVYIDDSTDLFLLKQLLQKGAIVVASNLWCIGEDAAHMLSREPDTQYKGSCYIGSVHLGGLSGMGVSMMANEWLRKRKPSEETLEFCKRFLESNNK